MTVAAWLWLLAITLTWPVPAALARARALLTVPRAAVVLWQSVAVAALLAVFGASLATILDLTLDGGRPGRAGVTHLGIAAVLVLLTVIALIKLNIVGVQVAHRLRRHRRRHRDLIDLLARTGLTEGASGSSGPGGAGLEDVRVLDTGRGAYAYCLPGRHSRVIISDAVLRDLTPAQVAAVIEHERAHLRARHDLLLEFFTVLYEAAGRRAGTAAALEQTAVLVELLADDAARRLHGPQPLIGALATMGCGTPLVDPMARETPAERPRATGRISQIRQLSQADQSGRSSQARQISQADQTHTTGRTGRPGRSRAGTGCGSGQLGDPGDPGVLPRLRRLIDAPASMPPPGLAAVVYAGAVALIAVPTLALALPWLTATWRTVH